MTSVVSDDFIDLRVFVDALVAEVHDLVKQVFKKSRYRRLRLMLTTMLRKRLIELSSIDLNVRRERMNKSGILESR